jgi:type VI secretion system protein ImpC
MSTEAQGQGAGTQTLEGASLLDEILAETKMTPGDEGYESPNAACRPSSPSSSPQREGEKVDKAFVDALIAEIDSKLSQQIDEILHHPTFQKLESAWRGLKFVIDRCDFRENIKVEVAQLLEGGPARRLRGLPRGAEERPLQDRVLRRVRQFGGRPYGAMIANYEFGRARRTSLCCRSAPRSPRWRTRPSSPPPVPSSSA